MEIRVAIVDPLPLFRAGAIAALRAVGHPVDAPDDVWRWLSDTEPQIVLVSLSTDPDWAFLADLHAARPDVRLLALVDHPATETSVRALALGAVAVLPRAIPADTLCAAVDALARGQSVIPIAVVEYIVGSLRGVSPGLWSEATTAAAPPPREQEWLRLLATGQTVADLARFAGYSERMMFRLLRSLYKSMHVRNRTEALIQARDNGWI